MLLNDKVAVIYGGGGRIGAAVARGFAREGATLFLAGRTEQTLATVAEEIRSRGGMAETAILDALDQRAVGEFVDGMVRKAGRVDISFNLISVNDVQQPLMEISLEDFLKPIVTAMRSQFITTHAAARHMIRQGSGVILTFGGSGPQTLPGLGGFKIALDALEGLRRQWALELGKYGIRVVTLKTRRSSPVSSRPLCSSEQQPWPMWATWLPSSPPIRRARLPRRRSTSLAAPSSISQQRHPASRDEYWQPGDHVRCATSCSTAIGNRVSKSRSLAQSGTMVMRAICL